MAQNITIAGASYSAVPSIQVPKTGSGTATFVDTSDADATAAGIMSGLTAYVDGIKLTGTASGGLEYESGIWSPSSAIRKGTIEFSNTHNKPPFFIAVWTTERSALWNPYQNGVFVAVDLTALDDTKYHQSTSYDESAGMYACIYANNNQVVTYGSGKISYGYTQSGNSSTSYSRYFMNESAMYPYGYGTNYKWQKTIPYNWIAVWSNVSWT